MFRFWAFTAAKVENPAKSASTKLLMSVMAPVATRLPLLAKSRFHPAPSSVPSKTIATVPYRATLFVRSMAPNSSMPPLALMFALR